MIGDHYGPAAGRATVLVRAVDAILGTHRHLDMRGAIHCTIRDGLVSDVEIYEEDLDAVEEFWA